MKKRKLLVLLLIGAFCLSGCSGKNNEDSDTSEVVNEEISDIKETAVALALEEGSIDEAKAIIEQERYSKKVELMELINNEDLTDEEKQPAIDAMVQITDIAEKELAAETMLVSQGYDEVLVSINDDNAYVLVSSEEISDSQREQIEDVVKRKTGIELENITITSVEPSEE